MKAFSSLKILNCALKCKRFYSGDVRVRFAPSPTGSMHIGGLRTALCNYLFAKKNGGKFILRIEDTDLKRKVPGTAEHLNEILNWSGLIPDESPYVGGPCAPYVQSERIHLYQNAAGQLIQKNAAYRCFCTKEELDLRKKRIPKFGYDNMCRHLSKQEINDKLSAGQPYVVRFKLENKDITFNDIIYGTITIKVTESEGDPVILKSDGYPTYHLANVVDDHLMNISHILRGVEWQSSTPKHIMLYNALSWTIPKYAHLPLALNVDGSKLSKRQNDIHVQYLKDTGYFPEAIINYVGIYTGGINHKGTAWSYSLQELAEKFDLENVNVKSNRMEKRKLDICNHHFLSRLIEDNKDAVKLVEKAQDLIHQLIKEKNISPVCDLSNEYVMRILKYYIKEKRISRLPELIEPKNIFLWSQPNIQITDISTQIGSNLVAALELLLEHLDVEFEGSEKENMLHIFNDVCNQQKINGSDLMLLIRKILSNQKEGPPVIDLIHLLSVPETKNRIRHALKLLTLPELNDGSRKFFQQG